MKIKTIVELIECDLQSVKPFFFGDKYKV